MTSSNARRPEVDDAARAAGNHADRIAVRPRRDDDLPALLAMLQRTHEAEGYPVRASAVRADWIAAPGELVGAVAVEGERVTGHVALRLADESAGATALLIWQQESGRGSAELAVVSRFFTDRSVPGSGTALLGYATERAAELGRVPVLQVDPDSPARHFYGRRGWREVGTATQQWGHRTVEAVLMVPPS